MYIWGNKHKVNYVPFVVVLALISCLFILSPEKAEAVDAKSSIELLLNISYRSKDCDTDACERPVTTKIGSLYEFSYCPDNTCDRFSMPISPEQDKFYDFILMYMYYKSGYIYLREIKDKYWAEHIENIAGKYISGLKGSPNENHIDCVLKIMAERHDIQVEFVRFDGNARQTNTIELADCKWK